MFLTRELRWRPSCKTAKKMLSMKHQNQLSKTKLKKGVSRISLLIKVEFYKMLANLLKFWSR